LGLERYEIRKRLGNGTFGVVYLAWDRLLECEVALKLPTRPRRTSEQDALDFLFEARILKRLNHPTIVPFHDVGQAQDGRCYVVSKYIQGENLAERLKQRGRFGPREAAELVRQVALALDHAHAQGLMHRDIKPANILLWLEGRGSDSRLDASLANSRAGEEGDGRNQANFPAASSQASSSMEEFEYEFGDRAGPLKFGIVKARTLEEARKALDKDGISYNWLIPRNSQYARSQESQKSKREGRAIPASAARANEAGVRGPQRYQPYIADFGLALKIEDVQLASQVAGTPAYMSPEQITGDVSQLDRRSDIFSLGVVFYELLVGKRPFHGKFVDLRREICYGTPKAPDRWHGDVPQMLGAICMKCLAKRPADRFLTGKELADELHRWLTPKAPEGGGKPTPDAPRDGSGVGMFIVGLVLGLVYLWFQFTRQGGGGSGSKPRENATSQTTRP
jgi:serine/threonine protein kinase